MTETRPDPLVDEMAKKPNTKIKAAADAVQRLAPLDDRAMEAIPGHRFFTLGEVAEEYGVARGDIVQELVRRRERGR